MASNSNLLQEAIADAKQVRSTAIESAKAALEEAFSPRLNSMLSQRIAEMDDDDVENFDDIEDLEGDDLDLGEDQEEEAEDSLDDVGDELEDVADAIDDLEPGDEDDVEIEADDFEEEGEDELDLESVIRELEMDLSEDGHEEEDDFAGEDEIEDVADEVEDVEDELADIDDDLGEAFEIDLDELMKEMGELDFEDEGEDDLEAPDDLEMENQRLRAEIKQYESVVKQQKETISEVNLLNAKLLYTTKIFRNYDLKNEQKIKVLESFDRASTVRDVKLVYTTLGESLRFGGVAKKQRITENFASKTIESTKSKTDNDNAEILSENVLKARMQHLANINKN